MLKFPEIKKPHLFIFGAGGTGGYFLEMITRLLSNRDDQVTIDIYDGDTVERKNIIRQNFSADDLDLNKADALVKKVTNITDNPPQVISHPEYITDADELVMDVMMSLEDNEQAIFITTVDNVATRRTINEAINQLEESVIAFDAGNHNQGGQVVAFSNVPVEETEFMQESKQVSLKNLLQLFPEIDIIKGPEDENPGIVMNCAEESRDKPQSMMANVFNATTLANLVEKVIENQSLAANVFRSDLHTSTISTERMV